MRAREAEAVGVSITANGEAGGKSPHRDCSCLLTLCIGRHREIGTSVRRLGSPEYPHLLSTLPGCAAQALLNLPASVINWEEDSLCMPASCTHLTRCLEPSLFALLHPFTVLRGFGEKRKRNVDLKHHREALERGSQPVACLPLSSHPSPMMTYRLLTILIQTRLARLPFGFANY